LQFTGQLAVSYGDHANDNIAFFLRPSYDSATGHFHVRYTHLGKYFGDNANAVAFIRDDNRREVDSALEKTFWIKSGPFERLEYGSNYNIYWGRRDAPELADRPRTGSDLRNNFRWPRTIRKNTSSSKKISVTARRNSRSATTPGVAVGDPGLQLRPEF